MAEIGDEQPRLAMRELARLEAYIVVTLRACGAAGLDVAELADVLQKVQAYTAAARERFGWPP
jgi:hypothetical protein